MLASSGLLFYQDREQEPVPQRRVSAEAVLLEPADEPGANAFAPSVAQDDPSSPPSGSIAPPNGGGSTRVSGSTDGLYAAVRGSPGCEAGRLATFLKRESGRARVWAAASGIAAADTGAYLNTLTPALTRLDIRVTDYGWVAGRPVARQAVMQAGTGVLLDRAGVPRVRCISGNPLGSPRNQGSRYTGPAWPGFRPRGVVVIEGAPDPLAAFPMFDLTSGQIFARIPGSVALVDVDKPEATTDLKVLEPGQQATVNGTLWPGSRPLTVTFDDPEIRLAAPDADPSGNFSVEITIPEDALPGPHQLRIAGGASRVEQSLYVIPRSVRSGSR